MGSVAESAVEVKAPTVRLFYANTVVPEYTYRGQLFKSVRFEWFAHRREVPVGPYADLIKDYNPRNAIKTKYYDALENRDPSGYGTDAHRIVDEYLAESEVEELRRYLSETRGWGLVATETPLPIDCRDQLATIEIPVGGPYAFCPLSEEDGYNLSVEVWGYLDVGDCERIYTAEDLARRAEALARKAAELLSRYGAENARTIANLLLQAADPGQGTRTTIETERAQGEG